MRLLMTRRLVLILLVFLTFFLIRSAQGLSQDEITLSFEWSSSAYYQGDSGSVIISLRSTCGDELEFTWVGIHFAWMTENHYYVLDLASNPVRIPSGGSIIFDAIGFDVSTDATVSWNEYHVLIYYKEHHWYGWSGENTWTSSTHLIYVHDAYEKTYNDLRPEVSRKITSAQSANYESPDAKSLLQQAVNEYDLADSLANQGKWQDAVSHLQTASNLLVQASSKEEEYQYQKQQQELANWRQKASDSINTADQKISQLKDCEGSEAKTSLQQAETQLANAQNSFSQATLQSYKDAYNSALQVISYADQASTREQEYQQEKQKASDMISSAEQEINQLGNVESPDAKQLFEQAQNQLTDARNAYNQKTIDDCKSACASAQQAINYAEQSLVKEQAYQEQKRQQQQLILIGGGISAVAIVAIIVIAMRRKRKPVTTTQT